MTSRFEAWNEEVLCKNASLIDAVPNVEEHTNLIMGPRSYEEQAFIQNGITWSHKLGFRPMTSRFKAWNEEVLCKNVSLIDVGLGPSVEEQTILFKVAQDLLKKMPLFKMA
ncbi:hypothetical protein Tco_1349089 [Tanacetum coccineum]